MPLPEFAIEQVSTPAPFKVIQFPTKKRGRQKLIPGVNDLATLHPEVLPLWDAERNAALTPADVMPGSGREVWWRCEKGHSWQNSPKQIVGGSRCPYCKNRRVIPGENDWLTRYPEAAALWDHEKNAGIDPVQIQPGCGDKFWWSCGKGHSWQASVKSVIAGSRCPYCRHYRVAPGETDLATRYPKLAAQWDFEKNGSLTPDKVLPGSHVYAWWRCEQGHSWYSEIRARTTMRTGCPYCSGRRFAPGINDLATRHPEVLPYWDWEKNEGLDPGQVHNGSAQRVWWKCPEGHGWQATVNTVGNEGTRCPTCARQSRLDDIYKDTRRGPTGSTRRRLIPGINDLATVCPEVAALWDKEKNGALDPCDILNTSTKPYWWKCSAGHSWQSAIRPLAIRNGKCPHC